jgi:hypothetical protein
VPDWSADTQLTETTFRFFCEVMASTEMPIRRQQSRRRCERPAALPCPPSASGTKRTSQYPMPMSAFGGKADMANSPARVTSWKSRDQKFAVTHNAHGRHEDLLSAVIWFASRAKRMFASAIGSSLLSNDARVPAVLLCEAPTIYSKE